MSPVPESSEHHRVPQSRDGSDHYVNKRRLRNKLHSAWHLLFGNLLPHEAIAQIVCENREVLCEGWVDSVRRVLAHDPERIYVPQAFRTDDGLARVRDEAKTCLRRLLEEGEASPSNGVPVFRIHFPSPDNDPRAA